MKTYPLFAIIALGASALLFNGCTTVNTIEPAQPVAQRQMMADKRVTTDASLNRHVRILGVNTATTPGGFLRIQVQVENMTRSVQNFNYRIEWYDENAMIIEQPTRTMSPRSVEGRETIDITAIAPTPQAKDFRIKFLEPTN